MKSKKEFALAMMEGRKFETTVGGVCYYDENLNPPFRFDAEALRDCWEYYNTVTEIIPWYKEIPKDGVVCRVWGGTCKKGDFFAVITEYVNDINCGFLCAEGCWSNAEPMTNKEILSAIQR